jgi:ABC-type multidrug transport system fused ATPase/permease subunit
MNNSNLNQLIYRLGQHIDLKRRVQLILLFLLMIAASLAEVLSIGAVIPFLGVLTSPDQVFSHTMAQPLIQALNINESKELLLPLTIIFIFGAILAGIMRMSLLWALTRLGHSIGHDLSISIYRRTLFQPYSVHVMRNTSEVIAGISKKTYGVVNHILVPGLIICSSFIMMGFVLLALLNINPMIAISAFTGFGLIYMFIILSTRKILARDSQRVNEKSNQVIKDLQEGLGGIRDVLIDGAQSTYVNSYRNADLPLRRAEANIAIISGFPRFGLESLGMTLIAILAYTLSGSSSGISSAIPVLGALALGAQRLLPVMQQTYSSWSFIRGGQATLEESLNLLDQPLPHYFDQPTPNPIAFKQNINLNNLAFKYSEDLPWILKPGLNLSIPRGSRIGLIGSTGSGKSTLLDIIMGLLQPNLGYISIDNLKITNENDRAWQAHIAHVPQAIFLSDASIAENIAFGEALDQIDYTRLKQSAHKAQISETIESWGDQYNTMVGERGVRLSGGQRQRIGIARALYKKADVIVLDEATSALDDHTESAVMKAIESLHDDVTIIIVAHRLTTLRNCTQIIELEDGQIKRAGSYDEIIGT